MTEKKQPLEPIEPKDQVRWVPHDDWPEEEQEQPRTHEQELEELFDFSWEGLKKKSRS